MKQQYDKSTARQGYGSARVRTGLSERAGKQYGRSVGRQGYGLAHLRAGLSERAGPEGARHGCCGSAIVCIGRTDSVMS